MNKINTLVWWKRVLLKYFPRTMLKLYAWKLGINEDAIDWSDRLFAGKHIQVTPLTKSSLLEGYIMTIDQKMTLWFYKEGNGFVYDGFEMGEYD